MIVLLLAIAATVWAGIYIYVWVAVGNAADELVSDLWLVIRRAAIVALCALVVFCVMGAIK